MILYSIIGIIVIYKYHQEYLMYPRNTTMAGPDTSTLSFPKTHTFKSPPRDEH